MEPVSLVHQVIVPCTNARQTHIICLLFIVSTALIQFNERNWKYKNSSRRVTLNFKFQSSPQFQLLQLCNYFQWPQWWHSSSAGPHFTAKDCSPCISKVHPRKPKKPGRVSIYFCCTLPESCTTCQRPSTQFSTTSCPTSSGTLLR